MTILSGRSVLSLDGVCDSSCVHMCVSVSVFMRSHLCVFMRWHVCVRVCVCVCVFCICIDRYKARLSQFAHPIASLGA